MQASCCLHSGSLQEPHFKVGRQATKHLEKYFSIETGAVTRKF